MSTAEPSFGWQAIDRALHRVYGHTEPLHYGTIVKYCLGGPDPLDGISIYKNLAPAPHWHYISYGLSELYEKESANRDVSGFGLELTFRLACKANARKPPPWALNFLQNLARYVFDTGNTFAPGHHMNLNGPIALAEKTAIRAVAFTLDPRLKRIRTPHGRLAFVQAVGLTLDELEMIIDWDTTRFLKVMGQANPLLITDLKRRSILADPGRARTIERRALREGSSMAVVAAATVRWRVRKQAETRTAEATVGALVVPRLLRLLIGRTLHRRDFTVAGEEQAIRFLPAARPGWKAGQDELTVKITPALAREMQSTLLPRRGTYQWPELADFRLVVVPSEIKDPEGKVLRVEG